MTELAEDADTSSGIKVATIVVAGDDGTYDLYLVGDDQALFELRDLELWLKPGAVLDYEANSTLNVIVEIDDPAVGADPDGSAPLAIGITDSDEPPQIDLLPSVTALAENADTSAAIKVADIVITDDTVVSRTFWLSGPDSAAFKIVGLALYLKAGTVLNHAGNPSLDVTINIDDAALGASPDDTDTLSITVTPVAQPPSTVDLSSLQFVEDQPIGAVVGTLSSSDPDSTTFTYALASGDGDDDNAAFEVDPETGVVTTVVNIDFELQANYSLRIRSTDDTGLFIERSFVIDVLNANDVPQILLYNEEVELSEDADTTNPLVMADVLVLNDSLGSQSYYILGGRGDDASLFEIDDRATAAPSGQRAQL